MEKSTRFEGAVLLVLSLVLVTVFAVSVWTYDDLAGETEQGTLSVFAAEIRQFMDENEAVAAFLGLHEAEEQAINDASDSAAIAAEAEAYIARYNGIYADLP